MFRTIAKTLSCAIVCATLTAPAAALNTRTWVSGTGVDQTGCGPIANPCRTLQYAHDNTTANGEINFKDSAGYGAVTITKAISMVANGVLAGVLSPPSSNAIVVSAGPSDAVFLQGLTIEGAGVGINGIDVRSAAKLTVAHCIIRGFTGSPADGGKGLYLHPATNISVSISDTMIADNAYEGIFYLVSPASASIKASLVATRLIVNGNFDGIYLDGAAISGGALNVEISDSTISHNANDGLYATGPIYVMIDNLRIVKNRINGITNVGLATTLLRRSTIFGNNAKGVSAGGAAFFSYRDNSINGNGTDVSGTIGSATFQ